MKKEVLCFAVALAATVVTSAQAAPPSKDECIEAHGRGQDLRDGRQITRARSMFLICATSACPALVQADCARFADELGRQVPSLTFAARDERGGDLPATLVFIDDILVVGRLDDGKSYDVDPGRHTIRFVHDGKDVSMRVVVNAGEKARPVVAQFGTPASADASSGSASPGSAAAAPAEPRRPILPLFVAGAGLVAAAVGAALLVVGSNKVPSSCSVSTKECAAAPGDKAFDDAHAGVSMMNTGIALDVVGAVALAGGLVWYFVQNPKAADSAPPAAAGASPFVIRF